MQQGFEHRDQERLADPFASGHPLVLGHAVHGIDVVEAFDPDLIALADVVHAQITGAAGSVLISVCEADGEMFYACGRVKRFW